MTKIGDGPAPVIRIVGARPNYIKMAPILRACAKCNPPIPTLLVHTGQHYDTAMNDRLFSDLDLPRPDVDLGVGSGSHAVQTAEVVKRFEPVIDSYGAQAVLVVGDVNSTMACALVATKRHVPVIHVEAGLRSNDRLMPEEINRVLTDQISDVLYTTERSAHENLAREGVDNERAVFVGNVMIDRLFANRSKAVRPEALLADAGICGTNRERLRCRYDASPVQCGQSHRAAAADQHLASCFSAIAARVCAPSTDSKEYRNP